MDMLGQCSEDCRLQAADLTVPALFGSQDAMLRIDMGSRIRGDFIAWHALHPARLPRHYHLALQP